MRILHISDLHFGDHNVNLKQSLQDRVRTIQPDLIIATGDLVENPFRRQLQEASQFIKELEKLCSPSAEEPTRPRLILVPGNHDVKYLGNIRVSARSFERYFEGSKSQHYFQDDNVWVHGFDSSREFLVGANGGVRAADLRNFDRTYSALQQEYGHRFEAAFKIVALHHHPVPIKYDAKHQRWLTLGNAGEFLGEILKRNIDLVIHGHEHIQADARYGRQLRTGTYHEVRIVGVGAALKNNPGPDQNRFNVITIQADGETRVDCYGAEQHSFDGRPWQSFAIRSVEAAKERGFEEWKKESGYHYQILTSITDLDQDGDARRTMECENLTVNDADNERAVRHRVSLPQTTGYIDLPSASPLRDTGLLELRLRVDDAASTAERVEVVIDYGRPLMRGEKVSYRYDWWAVNAFAMNERELRFMYGEEWPSIEFTHVPITDPIEELNIVLRFPHDFSLVRDPEPFVAKLRLVDKAFQWEHNPIIETQLKQTGALRFVESWKTAALRVHRPEAGYSYGIQWRIPPSPPLATGPKAGQIEDLLSSLLRIRTNPGEEDKKFLLVFLHTIGNLLREKLIPDWTEPLETSLMIFDHDRRKMVVVGAALAGKQPGDAVWKDYSLIEFNYGEGIGGKAFKTNKARLYVRLPEKERRTPDFYRVVDGGPSHAVLLALPVQNAEERDHVYGALNFGSSSAGCALRAIGEAGGSVSLERFRVLQSALNEVCFQLLTDYFLGPTKRLDGS